MDYSNTEHGNYDRVTATSGATSYGNSALNSGSSQRQTLHQRRSNADMRSESHAQPLSSPGPGMAITRGGSTAGAGRKNSIRNAVKKIFGRRSRDVGSQGLSQPTPPSRGHAYHKSEPAALSPPQELPELSAYPDDEATQQIYSDPYPLASPTFNRTASPYAVQFPNSVKLKPMDLGNPFMSRPAPTQLKRRKTLPSMVVAEREAAAIAARVAGRESTDAKRSQDRPRDATTTPMRNPSKLKKDRRKSRSADDLSKVATGEVTPPRKRSEEIRYWRESFQPDVLRASGFTTRKTPEADTVEEPEPSLPQQKSRQEEIGQRGEESKPPALPNMDNFSLPSTAVSRSGTFRSSPPIRHGRGKSGSTSLGDSDRSVALGTEMSKDLEDRVAKLEAGLQNFQRSLQRLTADRNRRTVIMGSITTRRSSSDMRTPSLLADTLADPLDPASYQYSYEQTALRPSTSPPPAQQEPQPQGQAPPPPPPQMSRRSQALMEDPFGPAQDSAPPLKLAVPADRPVESFKMPSPLSSHPPTQQPPVPSSSTSTARKDPPAYTFSSLYQMLADERSARRKLESQLKGLQREISDLHSQVAVSSQRSSYMLAGSSTRLQELLRETESGSSPPRSPQQRDSGLSAGAGGRHMDSVVSRFSVSESEAGAQENYDDLATPYEAYRTPREERSAYSLASKVQDDADAEGEMF